jgi:hypothetical protein
MNKSLLKDKKALLGFGSAIILGIVGITLAAYENQFWIAAIVISSFIMFHSVKRAGKISQEKK